MRKKGNKVRVVKPAWAKVIPLPLAGEGVGEAEGGPLASGMTSDGIPLDLL